MATRRRRRTTPVTNTFTLLDSAGRLQIPADMRDAYRIGGRVKLVEENGRILIVPSEQ